MTRALVTGAAGFIGSHLSERLLREGAQVIGVDCFTPFYEGSIKRANLEGLLETQGFEFVDADLSEDPLEELLAGVDVVYHLAAQAGVRTSFGDGFRTYVRHNVLATQRLLDAVADMPLQAFVYASSSSVYGNPERMPSRLDDTPRPRSPYGMTKVATEQLANVYHRIHRVPTVGLRYFTVYGPRQRPDMAFSRFIARTLDGEPLTVLGDGRQIRDFTFVADAVELTIAAAERGRPGSVYNIGGGNPVPLLDAIRALGHHLPGLRIRFEPAAHGDVVATCADPSRTAAELGTVPVTSLSAGLEQQVLWTLERRSWAPGARVAQAATGRFARNGQHPVLRV